MIKKYSENTNSLELVTDEGIIKLQILDKNIIRVLYTKQNNFSNIKSMLVLEREQKIVNWHIIEYEKHLKLFTDDIIIKIRKDTASFSWYDIKGNLLVKEPDKGGKHLNETEVVKAKYSENTIVKKVKTVDGEKSILENSEFYIDRKAYHTKLEFEWAEDEAIYGLGQHEEGILNYRGHQQFLFQTNMKISIPVIISTKGYGVFADSCSYMTFHDDQHGSYIWTDVDDEMDYYFIYGPEFDQIIHSIRYLTGKASMLPLWAFGYIQSKEHYRSQNELIEIAEEHRKRDIPLDCIVQDWKSWTGNMWGQKTFDPERYPDPGKMMTELHNKNVKLMISIWPNMRSNCINQTEMKEAGLLLGDDTTYDAMNEKARNLYWKQANEGLFSYGIDAWWCDSAEPFGGPDWGGQMKMEITERVDKIVSNFKKYIDPEYINIYSLMHSKGIYEGQRATDSSKRVVNLIRSAYTGQQQYGTIAWSGDISASWDVLKKQISEGLNFCATGLPYWTLDIGAFFTGREKCWRKWCGNEDRPKAWFWDGDFEDGCSDEGYRELYVRWFQYGAFLPVFRSHGTDTPREMWRFGEPGDITYDTLMKFDKLRYRLLPYIYSLAGHTYHNDYTIMRNLAFDFRHDTKVYNIDDQYMFGPAFMVCPVTVPMYFGPDSVKLEGIERKRKVYLPSGCDWYNFWTGKRYTGGRIINADAPLDTMPLYVKSGSIVALGPEICHTGEKPNAEIELRIYPGTDGEFELYEDEGDGYAYEQGEFMVTKINWDDKLKKVTFAKRGSLSLNIEKDRDFKVDIIEEK